MLAELNRLSVVSADNARTEEGKKTTNPKSKRREWKKNGKERHTKQQP